MMLKDLGKKLGVLLVLSMLVAVCAGAVSAADWTTYQGNYQRTGYVDEAGPQTNELLWSIENPAIINEYMQPPVVKDGKVYFSVWGVGEDTPSLFCYDAVTGKQIWKQYLEAGSRTGITVTDDYLYIGSYDGTTKGSLYCLNPENGKILGKTPVLADYANYGLGSVVVISDDTVWVTALEETDDDADKYRTHLYGFSLDLRSEKKHVVLPHITGTLYSSPSLSADGSVVYIPGDGGVCAYASDSGTLLWHTNLGFSYDAGKRQASTPVYSAGVIYISGYSYSKSTLLSALDAQTGAELWQVSFNGVVASSPAVIDSAVIVGTDSGISAYSLSGNLLWKHDGQTANLNSPVVAKDTVYYTTGPNLGAAVEDMTTAVYAVDADTGAEVWKYDVTYVSVSPNNGATYQNMFEGAPAVADGVLYAGDARNFFAIGNLSAVSGTDVAEDEIFAPTDSAASSPLCGVWVIPGVFVLAACLRQRRSD